MAKYVSPDGVFGKMVTPLNYEPSPDTSSKKYAISRLCFCGYKATDFTIDKIVIAPLYDADGKPISKEIAIKILDEYFCPIAEIAPIIITTHQGKPTVHTPESPIKLPINECLNNTFYIAIDLDGCYIAK